VNNWVTITLRNAYRIDLFNKGPNKTSRASSAMKDKVKLKYGSLCCVCNSSQNVSVAHILKHKSACTALKIPWDESNFLFLCGVESEINSCHGLFDNFMMSFIYTKGADTWTVVGGGPSRHGKQVTLLTDPYKRALHAHLTRCYLLKSINVEYDIQTLEESLDDKDSSLVEQEEDFSNINISDIDV
jgi:hypothetical protein